MSSCSGNCSSCGSDCADRKQESLLAQLNPNSSVKKVIAVVSGKGGVGKSTVTSMLAVAMARSGKRVGVLDADITGPSAPTAFGVSECQGASDHGLYPALTRGGIQVMSINLLLDNSTDPVLWRGPVIAGAVKQFWTDVIWEDVDYLFVDMPPGTGDVPLTVFQSLPIDGVVIVTTPQDVALLDSRKSLRFGAETGIPIIGIVENMSGFVCPCCGEVTDIFKSGGGQKAAEELNVQFLGKVPLEPAVVESGDSGLPLVMNHPDSASAKAFGEIVEKIIKTVE